MLLVRREIGDVLRELRLQKRHTLRQVAGRASVALGYLSEIERGQKEASSEILLAIAEALDVPMITGETPVDERERLFELFRTGQLTTLVVSKVANFSVDLPEASVAIQISGSYGSRQEEAQRLGRLLRPKADGRTASFYTLISRDTVDQDFAQNRQRFLAEQGYSYEILDAFDL